jgi:hypothetical protein
MLSPVGTRNAGEDGALGFFGPRRRGGDLFVVESHYSDNGTRPAKTYRAPSIPFRTLYSFTAATPLVKAIESTQRRLEERLVSTPEMAITYIGYYSFTRRYLQTA